MTDSLQSALGTTDPELAARSPSIDGVLNLRHLGGLPRHQGGPTVPIVLRSGNPDGLRPTGWTRLIDEFGLKAVVDLRSSHERSELDRSLSGRPVPTIHAPIIEATTREEYTPKMRIPDTGDPHMVAMAKRLLEVGGSGFVAAASTIAEHAPVLVHCSAGKDRTGILAALILRVAGVTDDAIAADYAASTTLIGDHMLELRNRISALDDPASDLGIRTFSTAEEAWTDRRATTEVMHATLSHLDVEWGGAEAYLSAHGIESVAITALRARLTGSAT
ncbi:MAG: tyrosine-protein phosphatase [Nitriliruptoraceae bacterium]